MRYTQEHSFQQKTNMYWGDISAYETLSEPFMNEHKNNLDWTLASRYQTLSESFIFENQDVLEWHTISKYQTLSENLIDRCAKQVHWKTISLHQELSFPFLKKHINDIDLLAVKQNASIHLEKEDFLTLFYDFVVPRESAIDFQFDTEKKHLSNNHFSIHFHKDYFPENMIFKEITISYEIENNEIVLNIFKGITKEPDSYTTFIVDAADFLTDFKTEHLFKMLVNHHLMKRHFITNVLPITFKDSLPF